MVVCKGLSRLLALPAFVSAGLTISSSERASLIDQLIHNEGKNQRQLMAEHEAHLTLQEAQSAVELPKDITGLIQTDDAAMLTDKSIAKAIGILNEMIENAQEEIDAKMISCKEFHNRITQNLDQIRTDLARFGANIASSEKVKGDSTNCIDQTDSEINAVQENIDKEVRDYTALHNADDIDMQGRVNDLAVAEFIMDITKCKKKAMLLENHHQLLACSGDKGEDEIMKFADPEIQARLESLLHSRSRVLANNALVAAVAGEEARGTQLLQLGRTGVTATPAPQKKTSDNPGPKQRRKCSLAKPNCGLLHDNMSLMWGEMKDAVDELQAKMDDDTAHHREELGALNMQKGVLIDAKTTCQTNLAEATSKLNANLEEQSKKQEEERAFSKEFKEVWGECQSTLDELIYTRSCGVRKVRSEVAKKGTTIKPDSIQDCEITEFIPQPCSSPCDRDMVGGTQRMVRTITQMNNEYGQKCPTLNYVMKCNQIKCPVNCSMSRFSSYSTCSKECGGGVQSRSRYMVREPKNGGESCDVTTESRACNTGSCDRNCSLHRWTKYTPCTQACDGGRQQKFRHVRRKTRARGHCPKQRNWRRYRGRSCNRLKCFGDEECIAKQDLILAIDGSGSVREKGWAILKNFTGELLKRYRGRAFKSARMRVGILQFGNGEILDDKTISPAKIISPLVDDIKSLKKKVKDLTWARGFTNMAQAFTTAKAVFLNGGRKSAQSSMIIITDGMPSFKFQTEEAVNELRDAGVHINIIAVRQHAGDETKLMKHWVSRPKRTHFLHVPGLLSLQSGAKKWVTKTIVGTCPKASSPKRRRMLAKHRGWKKIRSNQDCPNWWVYLGSFKRGASCGARAKAKGYKYYVFGGGFWIYKGVCYSHKVGGKDGKCTYKNWWNGKTGFVPSRFDTYALLDSPASSTGFVESAAAELKPVTDKTDKRDERPTDGILAATKFEDEGMTDAEFAAKVEEEEGTDDATEEDAEEEQEEAGEEVSVTDATE